MGVPGYPGFARQQEGFSTGDWALVPYTWRDTYALNRARPDRHHTVIHLFDAASRDLICWYVNFERPHVRRDGPASYDTLDLMLDLVVFPDHAVMWKDEEHWAWAVDAAIFDPSDVDAVERSREAIEATPERGSATSTAAGTTGDPAPSTYPCSPTVGIDRRLRAPRPEHVSVSCAYRSEPLMRTRSRSRTESTRAASGTSGWRRSASMRTARRPAATGPT